MSNVFRRCGDESVVTAHGAPQTPVLHSMPERGAEPERPKSSRLGPLCLFKSVVGSFEGYGIGSRTARSSASDVRPIRVRPIVRQANNGGRAKNMISDQVTCVSIGARIPPVARRSSPRTRPRVSAAKTSIKFPVATVATV